MQTNKTKTNHNTDLTCKECSKNVNIIGDPSGLFIGCFDDKCTGYWELHQIPNGIQSFKTKQKT